MQLIEEGSDDYSNSNDNIINFLYSHTFETAYIR
jgi:hypothetical protein